MIVRNVVGSSNACLFIAVNTLPLVNNSSPLRRMMWLLLIAPIVSLGVIDALVHLTPGIGGMGIFRQCLISSIEVSFSFMNNRYQDPDTDYQSIIVYWHPCVDTICSPWQPNANPINLDHQSHVQVMETPSAFLALCDRNHWTLVQRGVVWSFGVSFL